jgi:hypothetical protein
MMNDNDLCGAVIRIGCDAVHLNANILLRPAIFFLSFVQPAGMFQFAHKARVNNVE